MDTMSSDDRETRAARNQSLFREVNERVHAMNEALSRFTGTFAISCECADRNCIEQLELPPGEYHRVRAHPRQFIVLPGHVYPDVENVVAENPTYVVVEKVQRAGEVAEDFARSTG